MRKTVLSGLALVATGFLGLASASTDAAEIKLISSVGVKSAMEAILPGFERASGHKVTVFYGTAAGLKTRIDGGEAFDVAVLSPTQIDDLIKQGKAAGATRADLARAGTGLAIRAGAIKPDISTDEKLKAFLLGVNSISHGDPALGGFSTVYFAKTAATLGIADALKAKTTYTKAGEGATLVAKGETELGVGLMSEVIPVSGIQALPLKADDPASFIAFAGAVAVGAKDGDAARTLMTFIQAPAAKDVFKAQGMATP